MSVESPAPGQIAATDPRIRGAFLRYRVIAWITGVALLLLVFVAMPLKYFVERDGLMAIAGPGHGLFYMVYVLLTLDLGLKVRWGVKRLILTCLAGTIPFASFWAEHVIAQDLRTTPGQPQADADPRAATSATDDVELQQ